MEAPRNNHRAGKNDFDARVFQTCSIARPTAIGVYGLRLLGGDTSDAQIDAALTKLQARGDVVTFAERN